jgi:hypothetical protein
MSLGLNVNRFWFLNFINVSSILDDYSKLRCISDHIFSEILGISEKDWQLSLQSNFQRFLVSGSLRNAFYGVNTYQKFLESPRRIGN